MVKRTTHVHTLTCMLWLWLFLRLLVGGRRKLQGHAVLKLLEQQTHCRV